MAQKRPAESEFGKRLEKDPVLAKRFKEGVAILRQSAEAAEPTREVQFMTAPRSYSGYFLFFGW